MRVCWIVGGSLRPDVECREPQKKLHILPEGQLSKQRPL